MEKIDNFVQVLATFVSYDWVIKIDDNWTELKIFLNRAPKDTGFIVWVCA